MPCRHTGSSRPNIRSQHGQPMCWLGILDDYMYCNLFGDFQLGKAGLDIPLIMSDDHKYPFDLLAICHNAYISFIIKTCKSFKKQLEWKEAHLTKLGRQTSNLLWVSKPSSFIHGRTEKDAGKIWFPFLSLNEQVDGQCQENSGVCCQLVYKGISVHKWGGDKNIFYLVTQKNKVLFISLSLSCWWFGTRLDERNKKH